MYVSHANFSVSPMYGFLFASPMKENFVLAYVLHILSLWGDRASSTFYSELWSNDHIDAKMFYYWILVPNMTAQS